VANDDVVIDLTNYKDRVGSRVTPGRYRVRVDDAELDKTKNGEPMINVWLTVVKGDFEGSTVIDRLLPAHPKAQFRVVGFMQALGIPTPRKRLKLNVSSFKGRQLDVDIEDGEPYNGRVKSEIRGYNRIEKGSEVGGQADLEDIDPLDLPEDLPAEPDREYVDGDEELSAMQEDIAASSAAARAARSAEAQVPSTPAKADPAKAAQSLKDQVAERQAAAAKADADLGGAGDPDEDAERAIAGDPDDDGEFEAVDLENLDLG
jgi:hypothetical protein